MYKLRHIKVKSIGVDPVYLAGHMDLSTFSESDISIVISVDYYMSLLG